MVRASIPHWMLKYIKLVKCVLLEGKHRCAQRWNSLLSLHLPRPSRWDEGEEEAAADRCLSGVCEENYISDCETLRYPRDHISIYDKTERIISSTAVGTDHKHFLTVSCHVLVYYYSPMRYDAIFPADGFPSRKHQCAHTFQ